jgi:hypothetical protein
VATFSQSVQPIPDLGPGAQLVTSTVVVTGAPGSTTTSTSQQIIDPAGRVSVQSLVAPVTSTTSDITIPGNAPMHPGGVDLTVDEEPAPNTAPAPTAVPGQLKQQKPTNLVPNPLHRYASYTYSWSMWWTDVDEIKSLGAAKDVSVAQEWEFGPKSFVVAEDSGLYPNRRLPGTLGLNYNIQEVTLKTAPTGGLSQESTNLLEGTMIILEPIGITFVDQLVAASFDGYQFKNWTQQPFILQLDFKGYDDAGNPMPVSRKFRKRFPIMIKEVKINLTNKGAEYRIRFGPYNHVAYMKEYGFLDKDISVDGVSTVDEFFTTLSTTLNDYWKAETAKRHMGIPDQIEFRIDPVIGNSKILDETGVSLARGDPGSARINIKKTSFNIPAGTKITSIITKIMAHSRYLNDQLSVALANQTPTGSTTSPIIASLTQTQIFKAFKTTSKIEIGDLDPLRNTRAKKMIINIRPYDNWRTEHPALPQFVDSGPYTVKKYEYLYTGGNSDIIDVKIDFDTTFFTTVMKYTGAVAATLATKSTGLDIFRSLLPSPMLTPSLFKALIPAFRSVGTVSESRVRAVRGDQNSTAGLNLIDNPEAQIMMDIIRRGVYNQNAMINVKLTILGDPTLLKQDDWFYTPDPVDAINYNNISGVSQAEFAEKYGHIRFDTGMVPISLIINTPIDMDLDITNQGLVYPPIGVTPSLFGGQYFIREVENRFTSGKFIQVLTMSRMINSDFIAGAESTAIAERTDE